MIGEDSADRVAPAPGSGQPLARVVAQLARFYHCNGYVRWQDEVRQVEEGYMIYKKGHEVRLVADSLEELAEIRWLLIAAGFKPGRPFLKGAQFRQPVYGKRAVVRFLELVGEPTMKDREAAPGS